MFHDVQPAPPPATEGQARRGIRTPVSKRHAESINRLQNAAGAAAAKFGMARRDAPSTAAVTRGGETVPRRDGPPPEEENRPRRPRVAREGYGGEELRRGLFRCRRSRCGGRRGPTPRRLLLLLACVASRGALPPPSLAGLVDAFVPVFHSVSGGGRVLSSRRGGALFSAPADRNDPPSASVLSEGGARQQRRQQPLPPQRQRQRGSTGNRQRQRGGRSGGKPRRNGPNGSNDATNANARPRDSALERAKLLNRELIDCATASDVLSLFVSKGGAKSATAGGGGAFNSVNFSTAAHRIARYVNIRPPQAQQGQRHGNGGAVEEKRRAVLSDPRFAVFLCSLCEALGGADCTRPVSSGAAMGDQQRVDASKSSSSKSLVFKSRELSNVAWAIAKLRLAPPGDVLPVVRSDEHGGRGDDGDGGANGEGESVTTERILEDLISGAFKVRKEVLEVAKERAGLSDAAERARVPNRWIPTLSALSANLLDAIACKVLEMLDEFNSQELANLLWAFATASRADSVLFNRLAEQLVLRMRESKPGGTGNKKGPAPQELSNSVWAFATAGLRGPGQIALLEYVADVLDADSGAFSRQFKAQELSNTAWGLATILSKRGDESSADEASEDDAVLRSLRWVARALEERAHEFKPQEISNSIWAFATVGFGCDESSQGNTYNDYFYLKSKTPVDDQKLVFGALEVVAKNALVRLNKFRPQELNNLAWGFARLGHGGDAASELFKGIGREILRRHLQFSPQDVGTTLWSFATEEYYNEDVYRVAASRLTLQDAHRFKPQEMSNTIWALATAGVTPKHLHAFDTTLVPSDQQMSWSEVMDDAVSECFAATANEVMRRPYDFKEQEIKDVVWAFSKSGVRHPLLFKTVAEHLVGRDDAEHHGRGLSGFSPQGVGNLAWSYAKQAQLADSASDNIRGSTLGSNGRLAVYETSCLDIGEVLINRLFRSIAECGLNEHAGLANFKPQDMSNTAWAFAVLGLLHRSFFEAAAKQVAKRVASYMENSSGDQNNESMVRFKSQELANLVWAAATLNFRVPALFDAISPYIVAICSNGSSYDERSIARHFKRQELANLAWSCAVLEEYPADLMPLLYTGLVGRGENSDPDYLRQVHSDEGLQKQAIMTLFYVQLSADLEAPHLGLSLPHMFPERWGETYSEGTLSSSKNALDDYGDTSSMLELNTSRLQSLVSAALVRIGFNHVQEHVMDTDELLNEHKIELSSGPLEFLSIDLANLEDRVGIEVDGPAHFVNVIDNDDDGDIPFASIIRKEPEPRGFAKKMSGGRLGWQFLAHGRRQVNGPTALKHRLLSHLGWCVVHLPFWEWHSLGGDKENEDIYCRELLDEVVE